MSINRLVPFATNTPNLQTSTCSPNLLTTSQMECIALAKQLLTARGVKEPDVAQRCNSHSSQYIGNFS